MKLEVSIVKKLRSFTLDVSFAAENEVLALLGASGCGKSMTLKCITGLETPDEGRIALNDHVLFDSERGINLAPQKRHIGYLFQNYALFPNMTVGENILFAVKADRAEKERLLKENIERFRLEGLEDTYPAMLSGGQQQRVAFARILASGEEMLLLDEPFSALDSFLKWQLEMEVLGLLESYGGTAILVSHDRSEAYRLASRVAVLNRGHIDTMAGKEEVFQNPETLAATLLTGCKNDSRAKRQSDGTILATDWGMELSLVGRKGNLPEVIRYVAIRSHYIAYAEGPGVNTFPMEVLRVVEDVFSMVVMVRRQGSSAKPIRWELSKDLWQKISAKKSETLYLTFPVNQLILLER